jgi:hypothetical protein
MADKEITLTIKTDSYGREQLKLAIMGRIGSFEEALKANREKRVQSAGKEIMAIGEIPLPSSLEEAWQEQITRLRNILGQLP